MSKQYVIAWKSKITGNGGIGKIHMTFDRCARACEIANESHPDLTHRPFDVSFATSHTTQETQK